MDNFTKKIEDFRILMKEVRNECINLDRTQKNNNEEDTINSLKSKYKNTIDTFFEELWAISDYPNDGYEKKAKYLMSQLDEFFINDIEVTSYIRKRPLGYAGDFVTMNFIYDFNCHNFLGDNYYQKFINNYTCTIKVSNSNIGRKRIIKQRLMEKINNSNDEKKILSLGSGPAREIIELINEKQLLKPATFYCLDFEEKAIRFIKDRLSEMDRDPSKTKIHFLHENLLNVIKRGKTILPENSIDFVYISGVFDYFSSKVCQRMLLNMLPIIKASSAEKLLFFNMSSEEESGRAFYEMLGRWEMIHRTSHELLDWEKEFNGHKFYFKKEIDCPSYHIVEIK